MSWWFALACWLFIIWVAVCIVVGLVVMWTGLRSEAPEIPFMRRDDETL